MSHKLYIGLMSGTSLDGVDASIISTDGEAYIVPINNLYTTYPNILKDKIKKLLNSKFTCSELLETEYEITEYHIKATNKLLKITNTSAGEIAAIGFHGQTILHNPAKKISLQLGNPHLLANETNIDVTHDFRRGDIAIGGQGAPLVPIFHKAITKYEKKPLAIINIGGIANITYIDDDTKKNSLLAFDTGPGNMLIDDVIQRYCNKKFDDNGKIAKEGKIDYDIINKLLSNRNFGLNNKSFDSQDFNFIRKKISKLSYKNAISTLTFFTISRIIQSIKSLPKIPQKIYISGGGLHNTTMMTWLKNLLKEQFLECVIENISSIEYSNQHSNHNSTEIKFNPDFIESQAFAYLAARFCLNLPSAFPQTTNTKKENICGCICKPCR